MRTTFWKLLSSTEIQRILIPAIQRDYAQGRPGNASLRRNFLTAIKDALTGDGNPLIMDFVYGVREGCKDDLFIPIDGQQRLTTLWLLHWYVAYECDLLEDVRSTLRRFSYETRTSSASFCHDLCALKQQPEESKDSLRKWIVSQTWYYNQYKSDPTIQGMVNMICGCDDEEYDGINKVFNDSDLQALWNILTSESHIRVGFYNLPIHINDSDDLYVKMNARGRQLTNFENFKAELIEHVKKEIGEEDAIDFAAKLDVDWTDIFWHHRYEYPSNEISIDEIYFTFLRRFAYNELILAKDEENAKNIYLNNPPFKSFEAAFTSTSIRSLKKILNRIKAAASSLEHSDVCAPWDCKDNSENKFELIPTYYRPDVDGDPRTHKINKKDRPAFYALCRYFEFGDYDKISFNEWRRVVWNICDNAEDIEIKALLNLFDSLAKHSHDIMSYLRSDTYSSTYNITKIQVQMDEERQKSLHWEEFKNEITDAENFAFFKGSIRFLFKNERGEYDWSSFSDKFSMAKRIFTDNGLTDIGERGEKNNPKGSVANRILISYCQSWDSQIRRKYLFGKDKNTWRSLLLDPNLCYPVHNLLLHFSFCESPKLEDNDEKKNDILQYLVDGKYLDSIWSEKAAEYCIRDDIDGEFCLFLSRHKEWSPYLCSYRVEIAKRLENTAPGITVNWPDGFVQYGYVLYRSQSLDIKYRNYTFRLQSWHWTDMYDVEGNRLVNNDELKGCTIETKFIDPKSTSSVEDIKREFDSRIQIYETWKADLQ